jgi:ATP-binding cassette subfamily B protein
VDGIDGKGYDRVLMKRLLGYLKPYSWAVAVAVLLLLVMAPLELIGPYLVKVAIDVHIKSGDLAGLARLALLFIAISLISFMVNFARVYLTQWVGQKAMMDLRMKIFRHIQKLPLSYFDRTPVGALMTRAGSDVEVLQELFSAGVINIFGDIFLLVGIVGVMLYLNFKLALITFTVIPILFWATIKFRSRVRAAFRVIRQKVSAMNSHLQETITGMNVIQLFGQEEENQAKYDKINTDHRDAYLKAILYYSIFFPVVEIIGALGIALIVFFGGRGIIQGALTLGALVAFIEYTQKFFRPIQDLSEKYNILQSAMAASERIFQLLDTPIQEDRPGITALDLPVEGGIDFEEVRFAYNPEEEILKGISFSVKPGEKVAIVGATGAGKTSIINLLSRLYELERGRISIDGTDIRDIPLPDLRRRVGIVLQDIFLFSGNVIDNVCLDSEKEEEKVRRTLSEIGALNMFTGLPEGLSTPLRERANILSTGQKQLLAFARALVYDPPILILDEATSSLDSETEKTIQDALEHLLAGRTSLIIAHRLSTISRADRIIVMHHGRIRETGTHRELMGKKGFYYRLYQIQFNLNHGLPAAGA